MHIPRQISLGGMSISDILSLDEKEANELILIGEPIVFRAGSAEVLGKFWADASTIVLELVQITDGGEGVLPAIAVLAHRYAHQQGFRRVEWRVHAATCARPNVKLRRVLDRRGFTITRIDGTGECYYLIELIDDDGHVRRPKSLMRDEDFIVDVQNERSERVICLRHPSTGNTVSRRIGNEPPQRHLPELRSELERTLRGTPKPS